MEKPPSLNGMRILVAADKFRGTATAAEVAAAVQLGAARAGDHQVTSVAMSDGGEGLLEVFGGANRTTTVSGPLGDPVEAGWYFDGRRAVIESARASGLAIVGGAEGNDAMAASTYGTGELIVAALDSGAREIIVGVGGSATTDGGLGALRAIYPARLRGVDLIAACDVRIPFGAAARLFAAQKGATANEVEMLGRRLERLVDVYRAEHHVDVSELEGSGAGGGLAGGLAAVGAALVSGFEVVVEATDLDERMGDADLVVTGEGFVDAESFDGKVVGGVIELARECERPVLVIAGEVFDRHMFEGSDACVDVISLVERFGREAAMTDTTECIAQAVATWLGASTITA